MNQTWNVQLTFDSDECPLRVTRENGIRCSDKTYQDHKKRTKEVQCNIHNCPHIKRD